MTQNQKAILAITDKGVIAFEENDTVYIEVEETPFEVSEFEINFQAKLYSETLTEFNTENK
jgi:hypothetical protein